MTLVLTNGVFDVVHVGHVRLLELAGSLGNRLVVAINCDEVACRLKNRKVTPCEERAEILRGFKWVDEVVVFLEDTPEMLIQRIRPDVLVKGPEAALAPIPGAEFVSSIGGRVVVPDWEVTTSSTEIRKSLLR